MKIVFLNIFQGLVERGAERSTYELCRRLSHRNTVILVQAGEVVKKHLYQVVRLPVLFPNYPDSSLGFLRKFYLDVWSIQILFFTIAAIPRLLNLNYDILIPTNGGWQTLICRLISIIKNSKLVIIGRAGIGRDDAWNLLFKPDLFIALTRRAKAWAQKRAKSVKIINLPNGVDLKKFNPNVPGTNTGLPKPVILSVASLTGNKQLELTIKAVSAMKFTASLLIIGKGSLHGLILRIGHRLLGKSRFKIISTDFHTIASYYRNASLFTLASVENEAFGNVYLEAMACNLPVIAPEGYRREIIGSAGLYFQPDDIKDYTQKLNMGLVKDFGKLPFIQAKKFSWDKIYLRYEKAFRDLIKNSK